MRLWKLEFQGYWPVGAVAIANAPTFEGALAALRKALPNDLKGKNLSYDDIDAEEIEVPEGAAVILLDGDY